MPRGWNNDEKGISKIFHQLSSYEHVIHHTEAHIPPLPPKKEERNATVNFPGAVT